MSSGGDPRQFVLDYFFKKCGFHFDETSDLSPDTRAKIGDLAGQVKGIWDIDTQIGVQQVKVAKGTPGSRALYTLGALDLGLTFGGYIAGFIDFDPSGLILLGILLFIIGAIVGRIEKHGIKSAVVVLQKKRDEVYQAWTAKADGLSTTILEESRAAYQQKINPKMVEVKVDFAEIMKAAQGKGVILDRVKCPSCGASINLPAKGEATKCSYCGTRVTATSVLDQMKSALV